jgi:hypothetical protein
MTADPIMRLAEFHRDHPEIRIAPGEFGVWHADIPLGGNAMHYVAEHDLVTLLDKLDEHVTGPP